MYTLDLLSIFICILFLVLALPSHESIVFLLCSSTVYVKYVNFPTCIYCIDTVDISMSGMETTNMHPYGFKTPWPKI